MNYQQFEFQSTNNAVMFNFYSFIIVCLHYCFNSDVAHLIFPLNGVTFIIKLLDTTRCFFWNKIIYLDEYCYALHWFVIKLQLLHLWWFKLAYILFETKTKNIYAFATESKIIYIINLCSVVSSLWRHTCSITNNIT